MKHSKYHQALANTVAAIITGVALFWLVKTIIEAIFNSQFSILH